MGESKGKMLQAALRYAELGYPVFPCVPGGKAPATAHGFLDATTDAGQIEAWWTARPDANIGMPTAGLLVVDVDGADNPWPGDDLEGLAECPVSLTPRGGRHYIFRQPADKAWNNTASRLAPKVDTRANGGYIVLPPSVVGGKPYRWTENLETCPRGLPEPPAWLATQVEGGADLFAQGASRPAEDGQVAAQGAPVAPQGATSAAGGNAIPAGHRNATLARLGGAMRRVGMSQDEILAALTRANQDRCRPPLRDREIERIAASIARYEPDQVAVAVAENHWGQDTADAGAIDDGPLGVRDPGPMPDELFRIPGFVSEVMDHCLATAPYPNLVMSFAGALALQATLAGRKVRDPGDNRTNLYLLGLAHSAAGKDRPRKLNTEILHAVGLSGQVGGRFASGEGIQDALYTEPTMLFQTDEIDGMLQSINKSRDARHENIMGTMLTIYSSADSVFPMRRKAGKDAPGAIDQPCLVVFGTAIPNHYYEALSERMLTNGFFARMIILDCGGRSPGQEPRLKPLPERILETARWWAEFRPGTGNLEDWHPEPRVVPQTEEARQILVETRLEAEAEYALAEAADNEAGTTVWGRVSEHARKLALLYAISENHVEPQIGRPAAEWARRFVTHQARRMLFMAQSHVAENPFQAECLKFLKKLGGAPSGELPHSVLLKRMKVDAKTFQVLVATLEQRGDIITRTACGRGSTARFYRLVDLSSAR
ncbi:MAG TPA: bifunctional DNA primase/polymerase [Candidatus Krumholzibacteria bacterium]|nr:bifunctional DNA primase/polymerase [Candidatus Krumholzibacteria bacterium]HRY42088.1 bifunctional DNA primase/polymerase [Candidatus Krumholzibacteria bacterium]